MNKVIILEGPDGSGKTTLASYLVEKYGFEYRHEGLPPANEDKLHYYGRLLLEAHQGHKQPIVYDRFHLGEVVYAPIKRFKDELKYTGMRLMQRLIKATGTHLVICLPPYEVAVKSWMEKFAAGNDYLMDQALYTDSYYRFKALSAYFGWYDWTRRGDYQIMQRNIQTYMNEGEITLPVGCTGNPTASYLIVGETANHVSMDIPFFSMENSSGYLNLALWDAGFQERELAFTNAYLLSGTQRNLFEVKNSMPNFRVAIALGNLAAEACERFSLPYHKVIHPAAMKRFKNGKREEYVQSLKEIRVE